MNNEIKEAKVLEDGLMTQVVNPYLKNWDSGTHWDDFNKANFPRPLTHWHKPGLTVRVNEVKEFLTIDGHWKHCTDRLYNHIKDKPAYKTRIAFEVIEVAAGEGNALYEAAADIFKAKYKLPITDKADGFKEGYPNGFYDGFHHALDEVVKVLGGKQTADHSIRKLIIDEAIQTINQLRK